MTVTHDPKRSPFPDRSPSVPREHRSDRSPVPRPIRGTGYGNAFDGIAQQAEGNTQLIKDGWTVTLHAGKATKV